ncbi:MAG: hypothetical protein WB679_14890 [Terracidiphilus sp.]
MEIDGRLRSNIAGRFMAVASEADRRAIDTFGAALRGSGRPLVTTFGSMGLSHVGFRAAKPETEEDEPDPLSASIARAKTEENVEALASLGVRATMIRPAPSVHGDGDTGLVPQLIAIARKKGRFAYVGDGQNRWPAVHRRDFLRTINGRTAIDCLNSKVAGLPKSVEPLKLGRSDQGYKSKCSVPIPGPPRALKTRWCRQRSPSPACQKTRWQRRTPFANLGAT